MLFVKQYIGQPVVLAGELTVEENDDNITGNDCWRTCTAKIC